MKKRYKIIIGIVVFLAVLSISAYIWFRQQFELISVTNNIGLIRAYRFGANIAILKGQDGVLLVDTQLKALTQTINPKIESFSNKDVNVIINTHWHPDHNGGNALLGENANIIGHENLLLRLSSPQVGFGLTSPDSYHEFRARPEEDLPNQTINDSTQFRFNNEIVTIIHFSNAHTDTDLAVFFERAKVVCLGDLFWKGKFPYVDIYNNGNVLGLSSAIKKIIQRVDESSIIISGHSDLALINDLVAYDLMLTSSINYVKTSVANGNSLDLIQKTGLPVRWKTWSSKLVPESKWIEFVYQSLLKNDNGQ